MERHRDGMHGWGSALAVGLGLALAAGAARATPVQDRGSLGQERGSSGGAAGAARGTSAERLEAWGTARPHKLEGHLEFTYRRTGGKKSRSETVILQVPEDAEFFRDEVVRLEDLKAGQKLWLLGRPVERETPTRDGAYGGIDRQIQNVSAIAAGEGLSVNAAFKDARDPNIAWVEAEVETAGAAIWVRYQQGRFKVVMAKDFVVLRRTRLEKRPALKGALTVEVKAKASSEPVSGASGASRAPGEAAGGSGADKAARPSYAASRLVILDKRLAVSVYPKLLE